MSEGKNRQSLLLPILLPAGVLIVIGLVLFGFSRVLLAVSHTAATVVALIVATAVVALAAWVASRQRVTGSTLFSMVAAVAGVAMVAGGLAVVASPLQEEGAEEPGEEGVVLALAAPEGAAVDGFSTDALSAPSDEAFTIAFDNADPSIQHNVVVYDGPDAEAPALFTGELLTGPAQADYRLDPVPEGEYFFNCEVHPTTMTGTLTAAPGEGGEGGGGGGATTVVASELAFDTDTIELRADTPTTLTLDNRDDGIPHNVAIYTDESLGESLFVGDLVTGPASVDYEIPAIPAGEYYFHCDVHPDMSGTVVVQEGGGGGGGGDPGGDGGGDAEGDGGGGADGGGGTAAASVAAESSAFDPTTLSWAAGAETTLTFDNRDPVDVAGPHNVSIYDGDTALFQGDLVEGPATVDYAVPAIEAGTYEFRCDVHPEMVGSVEVT
ncbi:MAG TPA: cupredoxin domain-containing protein [Actinomycetota bacterium]